jgi:CO dehydrogenase maturation factor
MTTTIAVAGKGGTGKTTLAGLIVRSLVERAAGPVLAIDADPSSNLNAVLGMDLERTVGDIREDTVKQAKAGQLEAGIAKADLLDYEINACLEEGTGVDLLAMGRPEGPHCYCAANTMLRTIVDRIASGYEWVVMDTEAGLEHISRRTMRDVDLLLVVTDPTMRGVTAAGRVAELVAELGTRVTAARLVVNRVVDGVPDGLAGAIAATGLEVAATIAADPLVNEFDAVGRPLVELPGDDPTVVAVRDLVDTLVPQATASQGGARC